mmetsp:Transcript_2998/g.5365  ORF Transcript_2998/g.5365 Transcript_2998/m.5365 type:complete len:291 (-) Transcript_2998:629-1501(-)
MRSQIFQSGVSVLRVSACSHSHSHPLQRSFTTMRHTPPTASQQEIAKTLGFSIVGQSVEYSSSYKPLQLDIESLIFIPHGKTNSNVKLIFQSHEESADSKLLPNSLIEAAEGATVFIDQYRDRLRDNPSDFVFLRSPLQRTVETAEVYSSALMTVMPEPPTIVEDAALLEINHASWHGKTVFELHDIEQEKASFYRQGSFTAAPSDGESNLDLLLRCHQWLQSFDIRYRNKVVCVFGHGTFQNGVETLLCSYGATPPSTVFTREVGKSHLKRGFPHAVFPPFHSLRSFNI